VCSCGRRSSAKRATLSIVASRRLNVGAPRRATRSREPRELRRGDVRRPSERVAVRASHGVEIHFGLESIDSLSLRQSTCQAAARPPSLETRSGLLVARAERTYGAKKRPILAREGRIDRKEACSTRRMRCLPIRSRTRTVPARSQRGDHGNVSTGIRTYFAHRLFGDCLVD